MTLSQTGPRGARRQLTVMFCDLVGSTGMAEGLDPEVMRDVLLDYQRACAQVVSRFEGHIVQYQGDGMLVYFGYPRAHEDDARRAVLAGLDIVESVGAVVPAHRGGVPLSVRVGIHTGLVVVSEMGAGDWRQPDHVVGDAVNVAARVQAVAEPGSVVLSAATHQLVQGYIRVVSAGHPKLKGVTRPIELFRALGASDAESRLEAMPWRRIDLVDRHEARAELGEAWTRACTGITEAVLLVGEAGIGKSRLVEWAREHVGDDAVAVTLACSPYHRSTALSPVVRVLERSAGIETTDDAAARWQRLSAFLDAAGGLTATDVALFASLLSIPLPAGMSAPELSAEERRERTFLSLMAWVERVASGLPLLVAVEDLHWADPSTLELLRRLAERRPSVPLFLLFTSRSEDSLPFGGSVRPVRLGPLEPGYRQEMVDRLADGRLPHGVMSGVAARSDGIPLFIEELTCRAAELPLGHDAAAVASAAGADATDGDIPAPLADLFTARLEQLPDRGYLAQVVATVGASVPVSMLALVMAEEEAVLEQALDGLVDAGVLLREASITESNYAFRHVLLRDATYHTQLMSQRRELHRRIAEVIDSDLPEMATTHPEMLAHHLQLSDQPARAAQCWLAAGRQASHLAAHTEAVGHLRQALSVLATISSSVSDSSVSAEAEAERNRLELDVQMELGCSLLALRGYASPEAEAAYRRALDLSAASGADPGLISRYGLWAYYVVRGEHEVALGLARQALGSAEADGTADDLVGAAMMLGYQLLFLGELTEARHWLERAADGGADVTRPMPQDPAVSAGVHLAPLLLLVGEPAEARRQMDRALLRAEALGFPSGPFTRALAHAFAAWFHQMRGDLDEAVGHAQAGIDVSNAFGFVQWQVAGHFHLAIAESHLGETSEAVSTITGGLLLWRQGGAELFRSYFLAGLAQAHRAAGDLAAALAAVDDALEHVERFGERFYEAEIRRLRAELLLAAGAHREVEAEAELARALEVAGRQGAHWLELRAATSLHQLRISQGRRTETETLLAGLVASFADVDVEELPGLAAARGLMTASVS